MAKTSKVISQSEITSLSRNAKLAVDLIQEISDLENRKRGFEGMAPFIGISLNYEPPSIGSYNYDVDLKIDANLGSLDPLRDVWLDFQKKSILAIDDAIYVKKLELTDLKERLKHE
jgi:hypothetical protein